MRVWGDLLPQSSPHFPQTFREHGLESAVENETSHLSERSVGSGEWKEKDVGPSERSVGWCAEMRQTNWVYRCPLVLKAHLQLLLLANILSYVHYCYKGISHVLELFTIPCSQHKPSPLVTYCGRATTPPEVGSHAQAH